MSLTQKARLLDVIFSMSVLQGASLKELKKQCVDWYIQNKRPEITVTNLKNLLGRFLLWLGDREMTIKECRAYVKHMQNKKLAWSTVSSDTRRLKMFLTWLFEEANDGDGLLEWDWSKEVHGPRRYGEKEKGAEQLLDPEKMMEYIIKVTTPGKYDHALHRKIKMEHREFLLFLMKMGLRPGEAMNIKPEDVNLEGNPPSVSVWRGKAGDGGKWQQLGLPLDYLEPIRRRVNEGRWFDVTDSRLRIYMQRISKMAGKKVKLYSIRKSVDTFSLDADAPIMKLAIHQGHTVGVMQEYYTKFSAKQSSEVNNSYNPWIDRSKLDSKFMLPKIENLVKELQQHPKFRVIPGKNSYLIEWS